MDVTAFKERLKEKGCKLTLQRRSVLDILIKHSGEHLSTEELYEKVKENYPEIGLATVYRTVQLFEEMHIIDRLNFDDGCSRFELASEEEIHHHHHLICEKCNKVFEVENDLLEEIESEIERKYHFKIQDHHLMFYGQCEECLNKKRGK
ncbi:transcriptional repressor [Sporanaerobium hydrogeniformans]|uniref:Transcriptional repressor n=1 Tax=Sporanaerobium hydrogeniformans TaxID=3072179 RepID=A0AC61DE28_9FIRM|nr:Fur family transcriptional regulator [Sporanaerobium hydrogeniformans]PHV71524.1 transcriptional repressor [Sporanaerobium hydrogeniformans]